VPEVQVRRRFSFATPFVIVVGCRGSAESRFPETGDEDRVVAHESAAIDAPADVEIDALDEAAVRERDRLAREQAEREREQLLQDCASGRAHCNPPPPDRNPKPPPSAEARTGNPPMPARIVAANVEADGLVVVFARGADQGITSDWRADIVNDRGVALPGGACVIIRVDKTSGRCRAKLTRDQLSGNTRMRLQPR
jgi:hypothetical protein